MESIHCKTKLYTIGDSLILRLDEKESRKLSSRGLAMIAGTINGYKIQTTLEPDGKGSHWFALDDVVQKALKVKEGDTVDIAIEQTSEWIEPQVPSDIKKALQNEQKAKQIWDDITPLARWEWIRWIQSTKQEDTRKKRIGVAISKLNAGKRRPCCFNTNQCTIQYVSKNGVLLEPEK